jgi:glycosyltransferase involved in cell wall biosynthesis
VSKIEGQGPQVSVLMSVYSEEDSAFFHRSLESIWTDQELKPDQIVLIKNGPLNVELEDVIKFWCLKLPSVLDVINLVENRGFARALNVGLAACKGAFIARMDTDDISTPDRFREQSFFLNKNQHVDVVGSYVSEIDERGETIKDIVKYPRCHDELKTFFEKRDPLAHPSVMFRQSFFQKAGLYSEKHPLFEDTYLWFMGFKSGCVFGNLDTVCLNYRRTNNFYKRRGDMSKALRLLKARVFVINRQLNYSWASDFYALCYFLMSISPAGLKRFLYNVLR